MATDSDSRLPVGETEKIRNGLIEKVQLGEMRPEEADAEAVRLNVGALERRPDSNDFDPIAEKFWTLPMAVAWIAFRDANAVREWWDKYRLECMDWRCRKSPIGFKGPVTEGYFLEQRPPATLTRMKLEDVDDGHRDQDPLFSMTVENAIDALIQGLRSWCFEATGVDVSLDERVGIPGNMWHDLKWSAEQPWDVIRSEIEPGVRTVQFEHVLVPRGSIMALWSEPYVPITAEPVLPPLVKPEGGGFMPLYCAAQWIASKGGSIEIDPEDMEVWWPAYADLLNRVSSEDVEVVGRRNGKNEEVPGYNFAAIPVVYPFDSPNIELMWSGDVYLDSAIYEDESKWQSGNTDSLGNRSGKTWTHLMVRKSNILREWPFDFSFQYMTREPGRPSGTQLVLNEFEKRCSRGEVEIRVSDEAKILSEWFRMHHKEAPRLRPKTIENRIRGRFREYQNTRK